MAYNRMKSASRQQEIEDRQAEMAAVDNGTWPRDLDDDMRWGVNKSFNDMAERAAWARKMCDLDVQYLRGIPPRIVSGELAGWEL